MGSHEGQGSVNSGSKRSRLKWAAAAVVLVLMAATGGLVIVSSNIGDWTKRQVIAAARQQGLVLELNDVDVSLTSIHFRDARAVLEGVAGLTLYLQSVDIALHGWKPVGIRVAGAIVQAVGAPTNLLNEVRAWQAKYPFDHATLKPDIAKAKVTWQEALDGPPFLVLDGVTFASSAKPLGPLGQDFSIHAERAQAGAYGVAPLVAALHSEPEAIEIGIGSTEWESMTVRGGWKKQQVGDELHVSLGPLPFGPMLAAGGIKLDDLKLAAANAAVGISLLRTGDTTWPYQGHFAVELAGFTPPHPPELQGFDFGKSTRVDSTFRMDAALATLDLLDTRLTAGEFKLAGHGKAHRTESLSARVQLELKGHLACASLASALATSKLGQSYGQWVMRNANKVVQGSVDVTVQVDADSKAINQAKVAKVIGVGCGLKPLTIRQLLTLDLPPPPDWELVRKLGKDIPNIGGKLPGFTNLNLPELPTPDWMKTKPH
jgi:hypothetical protein